MNKSMLTYFSIGLVALVIIVVAIAKHNATTNPRPADNTQQFDNQSAQVQIEDIQVGDGAEAQLGSNITVRYTGTLEDGTVFDTTGDGEPRSFDLVQGGLIDGWIEGIPGMKVGGKRKLIIPASKAYGSAGQGSIPPNADLTFEIELISVQ